MGEGPDAEAIALTESGSARLVPARTSRCTLHVEPLSRGSRESLVEAAATDTEIMRGVRLSTALRRLGAFWRTSPLDLGALEREHLWDYSQPCDTLDAFISQTWLTPGWQKYLVLVVHFYAPQALAVGFLVAAGLFLLDIAGRLPTVCVRPNVFTYGMPLEVSPWCLLPSLVTLGGVLLGPAAAPKPRDRVVFFDALCINQSDDGRRQLGIYSIDLFLQRSKTMVVLWTPQNLTRMWCVYELAVFSSKVSQSMIVGIPISQRKLLSAVFVMTAFVQLPRTLAISCASPSDAVLKVVVPFVMVVGGSMCARVIVRYFREMQDLSRAFDTFDVDNAGCREARDRKFMIGEIESHYGSKGEFNRYVRGPLKARSIAFMERHCMTYRQVLSVTAPLSWFGAQTVAGVEHAGLPRAYVWRAGAFEAVFYLLLIPAGLRVMMLLARAYAERCAPGRARDFGCSVAIGVCFAVLIFGPYHARTRAVLEDARLAAASWTLIGLLCGLLHLPELRSATAAWRARVAPCPVAKVKPAWP